MRRRGQRQQMESIEFMPGVDSKELELAHSFPWFPWFSSSFGMFMSDQRWLPSQQSTSQIFVFRPEQVLSRKRPRCRWGPPFGVVFARCASSCTSLPTLPGAASAVLASSACGGCVFVFWSTYPNCLFVRTHIILTFNHVRPLVVRR